MTGWGGCVYPGVDVVEKWPVFGRHELAARWLQVWSDLGRAPRTIDAYARGLGEFLWVCERDGIDPITAGRADIAGFVRELRSRPSRSGVNVVALDSGAGLSNATLQQRLSVTWSVCSTTSLLRKAFGSPIPSVGADRRNSGSSTAEHSAHSHGRVPARHRGRSFAACELANLIEQGIPVVGLQLRMRERGLRQEERPGRPSARQDRRCR